LLATEQYLRSGDRYAGPVNLVANPGQRFALGPLREWETYVIPGLTVVVAGKELLSNYHRFGKTTGLLRLEQLVTDSLGVQWDRLSEHAVEIGTAEDWTQGLFEGTRVRAELSEAGKQPDQGPLVPDTRGLGAYVPPDIVPLGPARALSGNTISWRSRPLSIIEQKKYRVDIEFLGRNSLLQQQYSLTHWDNSSAAPGDPVSLPAPPAQGPLGTAIDHVLERQARDLGVVDHDANSVRLVVYFDITEPGIPPRHVEDLIRRPPIALRFGVYSRLRPHPTMGEGHDPLHGRREGGVFRSFRELLELAGDFSRSSAPAAYDGDDIAFLRLPLPVELRGRSQDRLVATFEGDGLSLLEIRADGGALAYDRR
jgi:hypothetical protein